jgi:hypothetical protein
MVSTPTPPDSDSGSRPFSVSWEGRPRRATVCASCLPSRRSVLLLEPLLWKRLGGRLKRRGEEILMRWRRGGAKRRKNRRGSEAEALRIVLSRLYMASLIQLQQ